MNYVLFTSEEFHAPEGLTILDTSVTTDDAPIGSNFSRDAVEAAVQEAGRIFEFLPDEKSPERVRALWSALSDLGGFIYERSLSECIAVDKREKE